MPTRRGRALFGEGGWDPYMEDPGTLWLLHWLLLAPKKSRLPVWWLAFNEFNAIEFAEADLQTAIFTLLDGVPEWHKPHPNSINKDISALLRTYAPRGQDRPGPDRRHAGLPAAGTEPREPARRRWADTASRWVPSQRCPRRSWPMRPLDYVALTEVRGSTVTISRLVHGPGAPGQSLQAVRIGVARRAEAVHRR